jgi:hypothetical protein
MKRGQALLLIAHCGNAARPVRGFTPSYRTASAIFTLTHGHMHEHHRVASIAHTRPPIGSFHLVIGYREVLDGTHGRQRER